MTKKKSIEPEYNQMCIVYNSLKDCLIPHINNVKPMSIIQIDRILSQAQRIAYNIEQRALNVSKIISKKEKEILKDKDNKVFDVLCPKGWNKIDNFVYRRIAFLDGASLLDKKLISISKFTKKGDKSICNFITKDGTTSVISSKANYDIFPEAFKILNEKLVYHINHTEHLSYYQIHCITTVIEYVLNMLKDKAYAVYYSFPDIKMHYLDELEYFVQEPNRQEDITETYKILLKTKPSFMLHMQWKAARVKHLQSLFHSDEPHDEAWFVENGYMYNENF